MKLFVYLEAQRQQVKPSSLEVLGAAREIADAQGGEVVAWLCGHNLGDAADQAKTAGAHKLVVSDDAVFDTATANDLANEVKAIVEEHSCTGFFASATPLGRDLSALVAVDHECCPATDCTLVEAAGGGLRAQRPVYAGKAILTVELGGAFQVVTIRPNYGKVVSQDAAEVTTRSPGIDAAGLQARITERTSADTKKVELTEAEIIVSGGRAMKGPENFSILEELATELGAAVGASRAAVDAGWRPHADQVGQTGKTVSPKLYVACGISGAIQHLAGMSSSKCIVAINKDKNAPIFQVATYGIVGDLYEVVPALKDEIARHKA